MTARTLLGGLCGLAVLLPPLGALAATARAPGAARAHAGFTPPRLGPAYGRSMANWPDWTGAWTMTGGKAFLLFDTKDPYLEPDAAGGRGGLDFGFIAGSHDTTAPLKPETQKLYDERIRMARDGMPTDPIGFGCRPYGMPRVMAGNPTGPQFVYSPQMIVVLFQDDVRRIFMDGRGHPGPDDAVYTYEGHSIGRWEGDTLVVDTVQTFPANYDQSDLPHSDKLHVVERIRQTDAQTLENTMTVEDPVYLTRPWVVTRTYKRAKVRYPERTITNCTPDAQVANVNGAQVIQLPTAK